MDKPRNTHERQVRPRKNPTEKFAGVYELVEIYDPDFEPGDLLKYELLKNYKIIIMDGGQIWLNDTNTLFMKQGTFVLDELDELETDWGMLMDTAQLLHGKLIIQEMRWFGIQNNRHKVINILRTHEFFGKYLLVNDYNDSLGTEAITKKYLRVKPRVK